MALSKERKLELARMTLPTDAETVKRALDFRQRSGLTPSEFSLAVGYSDCTVGIYLTGHYGENLTDRPESATTSNTRAIRYALKQFMDRYEGAATRKPLAPPHKTKDFTEVRKACLKALANGSACVIDGPPGTQKTFSLKHAVDEINRREDGSRAIYIYARIDHTPQAFLQECCNVAGIASRGHIDQLIRKLGFFLSGGAGAHAARVLFVVDEAQHLEYKCLEVLRQLFEQYDFGGVLAGSHDLNQKLIPYKMEQWRSRVRKTLYLDGPSKAEACSILRAELCPILGDLTDAQLGGIVGDCISKSTRIHKTADDKQIPRKFQYISARDLFFAIEEIKQTPAARQPAQPASQKEDAA